LIIETELILAGFSNHVEEERLEEYSMGCLPETETAQVEEHILICESCQDKLDHLDSFVRSMRHAGKRFPMETESGWQFWRLPRFAQALAAAVILVFIAGVGVEVQKRGAQTLLAVALQATRGESTASAPAGRPLLIQPDIVGLPNFPEYRIEVVTQSGKVVRQSTFRAGAGADGVSMPAISAGVYFVRLYNPAGELLREYALEVKDTR
jgi:hypothetical protein